jgi:WD40 repeat protein
MSCRFSSANTYAISDSNGNIFYHSATYGSTWNYSNGNNPTINALSFSSNANLLGAGFGGNRQRIYIFNSTSNTQFYKATIGFNVLTVDYSPDITLFATGDGGGNLRFYEATLSSYFNFLTFGSLGTIASIDFSNDSCWIAAGSSNKSLYFYTANCMKKQTANNPPFRCAID